MQGLELNGLLPVPFVLHDLVKEIAGQARNDAGGIMAGLTTSPVIAGLTPPVIAGFTPPVIAGLTPPVIAGLTPSVIAGLTRNLGGAQTSANKPSLTSWQAQKIPPSTWV
ncbi:MAG: hypothetical protein ACK53K_04835 [Burkholderiales bacterium]